MSTDRRLRFALAVVLATMSAQVAWAQGVREVSYQDRAVIPIHARLRYTTVISLPEADDILDFLCGDKEYWIVNGAHNLAYIKPAKPGGATNLTLITASGRIYTFLLQEGAAEPDLKVLVTADGAPTAQFGRRFYTADDLTLLRNQLSDAQSSAAAAKRDARAAIEAYRVEYPRRLHFDYRFDARKAPFNLVAVWHDGQSTFIRTTARELPALYEERDGRPQLLDYKVDHDTYVVPKVLNHGVLKLGRRSLSFTLSNVETEGAR